MNDQHAVPPHAQLIQMGRRRGCPRSSTPRPSCLADHLAGGPKSAVELAAATGTHAPSLHRLMRTLAGLGILTEREGQRFALTPLGEALKSGAPGSARATCWRSADPRSGTAWEEMIYSLETGRTGFEKAFGMPLFDFLAQHPEEASQFSETMVGFHGAEPPAVAEGVRFLGLQDRRGRRRCDRQPARGHPVAACRSRAACCSISRTSSATRRPCSQARGVERRVTIEGGDFFERVPAGGDAYVLSHIIHDWSEEQCLTILGHCRRAMKPDGRLLIVEMVLPAGDAPHPGKVLDMVMLVVPGGQERTKPSTARCWPRRLPAEAGRADRVGRERGGSGAGLARRRRAS